MRIFEQLALRTLLEWVKRCRIQIEYHIGEDYKRYLIVQGCRPMHKLVPGGNILGGWSRGIRSQEALALQDEACTENVRYQSRPGLWWGR